MDLRHGRYKLLRGTNWPKGRLGRWFYLTWLFLALLSVPGIQAEISGTTPAGFFDAHLHYPPSHAQVLPPVAVAAKLAAHAVRAAVVMTTDADLIAALAAETAVPIVPFLEVSRRLGSKLGWMHEPHLGDTVSAMLDQPASLPWAGLGEFHIMADDRFGVGFAQLLELAVQRDLPVSIHGDPAVIDHAFVLQPDVRILWAHAGSFAYPPLLADYLTRYPNLSVDLSMRNPRIAPQGELAADWFDLFLDFPDRFMLGVDTFSLGRWAAFGAYFAAAEHWLRQLPDSVAQAIALDNGLAFFRLAAAPDASQ